MIPATAVIVAVVPAIVIAIAAAMMDAVRTAATRVVVAAIIVRAIIESAVPHASAVDRQQAGAVSLDAAPYILRVDCGRFQKDLLLIKKAPKGSTPFGAFYLPLF